MKRRFPVAMLVGLMAVATVVSCGGRDHALDAFDSGGGKKPDGSTPVTDAKGSGGGGGVIDAPLDHAAPDPDAGDAGKAAGATCTTGAECEQGICADGVCCRTSCADLCHSCNISGSAGTCVVVPSGQPARAGECAGDGSKCGKTGACDGAGACAYGAKDSVCADAVCDPTTYQVTAASQCDGKGACVASGQKVNCAPAKCNAGHTGCANPCASSNDCVAPNLCQQGTCGQSAIGVVCTGASQCQTGNCVDGVCCDKPCAGQCEACDNSGALGTCKPVSGAPHHAATPARAACGGDPACAGKCDGSNGTACAFGANVCRSSSCASGAQVNQATCTTNGACPAMTTTSCQFVCVAATGMCGGSCKPGTKRCATNVQTCAADGVTWTDSEVCGSTKVCSNNACVTACVAGVACTDGIGPCRAGKTACASPTSAATCQDSGADDNHNTCTGGKICSGGACVTACVAGAACRPSACHSGKTVCSSPTATPTCSGSTVDDTQGGCSGGNICVNGGCVAPCVPKCVNPNVAQSCNGNNPVIVVCDSTTMTCDSDSKTCVPCGQMWGQKCCPAQNEGDNCMAGPESFCLSGICTSTGHLGEPCIPGGTCKFATTVCKNNMCITCGPNAGATCCDPNKDDTPPNGCTPL
ncbi:MAG TPA: hypothetical protein VH374_23915 [Polyangia bacterium]|nr:hypothetical protein [Polyangia bacterium]